MADHLSPDDRSRKMRGICSRSTKPRYCGVAPVPRWSGSSVGQVRMTRSGNRQLNVALHTIAVVQIRLGGHGQVYYRKRREAGDSPAKALRCLKRRSARVVYQHLKTDHKDTASPPPAA